MQYLLQDIQIGQNLKRLRQAAKFTQEDLVRLLQLAGSEMSRSTYSQIESGARNLKVSDLILLKSVLKCKYDDIIEGR